MPESGAGAGPGHSGGQGTSLVGPLWERVAASQQPLVEIASTGQDSHWLNY